MLFRTTFLTLALTASVIAQAQTTPPPKPAPAPSPAPATVRVVLETDQGRIVLELEKERAPVTTANFLRYVDQKRLDGIGFYRTVKVQAAFGFVQFGVQNAPKRVLPPIKHEPTTQTGVKHLSGTISTARYAPGTATGDFTIMVGDQPSLDADPSQPGDNLGYAAFGHVVEGMDVVIRVLDATPSPTAGEGVMKGQMLVPPILIRTARRLP
ncbi:peptidylprolyl isomerase [Sphingomonas alpina]|uniref:peptidylprolyl isomerase n=1 Tax=Sphingomonas alpina TaxID=653931 RepID=A0A7H0LMP8_9SPHN|nr:peptidylprolyl isomerase [Sphingomonas alpina]QNQ10951.1 peptidylprolyl isomerase [Sphingomonas alpina]